ncbi:MAG: NADH-quinone oxidoreductase subunit D [Syntrophobacteria bacterium]
MATQQLEPITEQTFFLNLGPQHPSTHGVLRLFLKLDGEYIVQADPVIGYGHRGHEKMAESHLYEQFLPNPSRIDYLSGLLFNHGYVSVVEKMAGIEVPPRAEYIRVICAELNRISSHLLWFGTFVMDLGGFTPFLYAFDDRENIIDILDRVSGSRLTYSYCRFGGVAKDIDEKFIDDTRQFIRRLRSRWDDYDNLVTKNVIFINRTRSVGVINREMALRFGCTGPILRGAGVPYDIRKAEPYSVYPEMDFEIPTGTTGDAMDRYKVRLQEMEQSLRIVEQALDRLPEGPVKAPVPVKIRPPRGDYYFAFESARGAAGFYIVSDGTEFPYRLRARVPSFGNLQVLTDLLPGTLVADTISILGSIDIVVPEVDR